MSNKKTNKNLRFKRFVAILLAVVLVTGMIPSLPSFAEVNTTETFAVTFNYGDETKVVQSSDGKIPAAEIVTAAEANGQVADYMNTSRPISEDYGFVGWYDENGNKVDPTTLTEETTLTAKYEPVAWASIDIIEYGKLIKTSTGILTDTAKFYHVVTLNSNVEGLALRTPISGWNEDVDTDEDGNQTFWRYFYTYLPSGDRAAMVSYSIPGVSNGVVQVKAEATIDTDPNAPGLSTLKAVFNVEDQSFVISSENTANIAPTLTMTYGTESESFTMTGTTGAWEATISVSDSKYDGVESFEFGVGSETTELKVYEITAYKDNYGTPNNEIIDTYYVLSNSSLMDILPATQDEYEAASGVTLSSDQKLAVGKDASNNTLYSWYYKADDKFDEVSSSTTQAAINEDNVDSGNKEVYPVILSKVVFNDENGVPIDIYHHVTEITEPWLWTSFLGSNNNLYSVSTHRIPDTGGASSLGYEWEYNGRTYSDTEIPTLEFLTDPVTFSKGSPVVPVVPFDGVEVVWSDSATEAYLIEAIRDKMNLDKDDEIKIASPAALNVIWADEPDVNGSFNNEDVAIQEITFKVNDGEAQIVNVRIYPRVVMVNRINTHIAVQGSNVIVDYEDEMTHEGDIKYPHGYSMEFTPDEIEGLQLTGSVYEIFYKSEGVNAYLDQPIIGLNDWTPVLQGETYSHDDLNVVYKGVGEVYQQHITDGQKYNVTKVDVSAYSNYYVYQNQGSLKVFAAEDFETSKIYDGQTETITADQLINNPTVRGDIDVVEDSLEEGQQLVVRFNDDYSTSGVNFNQTSYTTPSENVGTYDVLFKIFVADENGNVLTGDHGETASIYSSENAYTATIEITPAPLNIAAESYTKLVGEVDPTFEATVTGLIGDDVASYTLTRVAGETVGDYPINVNVNPEDNPNYDVSFSPGNLEITAPAVVTPITPPPVVPPTPVIPPVATPGADAPVTIEDTETPLASGAAWSLLDLILTVITGLLAVSLLVTYFKRRKEEEEDENVEVKRKGLLRMLSIVPMIGAIVLFILTQDMTLPMIIIDEWTIVFAAITLVQAGITYFSRKKVEEEDDQVMA